jgi:hypothetical protein
LHTSKVAAAAADMKARPRYKGGGAWRTQALQPLHGCVISLNQFNLQQQKQQKEQQQHKFMVRKGIEA